jgi:hypothetical protein
VQAVFFLPPSDVVELASFPLWVFVLQFRSQACGWQLPVSYLSPRLVLKFLKENLPMSSPLLGPLQVFAELLRFLHRWLVHCRGSVCGDAR